MSRRGGTPYGATPQDHIKGVIWLASNCLTSLVFDRDMLEQFCGADLPWSSSQVVARMGVEYRNDLLGHVHALGPSVPPSRYFTGHDRSDHPDDWPPNKAGCEELRALDFLDTLETFVGENGHFDPQTRQAHFGDFVAVLDQARSFYRHVLESAGR